MKMEWLDKNTNDLTAGEVIYFASALVLAVALTMLLIVGIVFIIDKISDFFDL